MPKRIGDRRQRRAPVAVGGKAGRTYYQEQANYNAETDEYLQTAIDVSVIVMKAGATVGTRQKINFIDGVGIGVTVADDSANGRVNVTPGLTLLTTKGDLAGRDGTSAVRVPVGADNTLLKADSAAAAGVSYTAAPSVASLTITEDDVRHGDRVLMVHASAGLRPIAEGAFNVQAGYTDATTPWWTITSATAGKRAHLPVTLAVGDRIKSVKMYGRSGDATSLWQLKLFKVTMGTGTVAQVGGTQTSTNGGAAANDTLSVTSLTETVATGVSYFAEWLNNGAGTAERRCYGIEVTYDHPA